MPFGLLPGSYFYNFNPALPGCIRMVDGVSLVAQPVADAGSGSCFSKADFCNE
jgi:hypothetical protein